MPPKAAAIALKQRVKLYKGDWVGVVAEGAKLISAAAQNRHKRFFALYVWCRQLVRKRIIGHFPHYLEQIGMIENR